MERCVVRYSGDRTFPVTTVTIPGPGGRPPRVPSRWWVVGQRHPMGGRWAFIGDLGVPTTFPFCHYR